MAHSMQVAQTVPAAADSTLPPSGRTCDVGLAAYLQQLTLEGVQHEGWASLKAPRVPCLDSLLAAI